MEKKIRKLNTDESEDILQDIAAAVCDGMCTKLDGLMDPNDEEERDKICEECKFGKAYDELARILKNFDAEYLKICKENDRIQRRLNLYDLCSDMS